ncbi:MAG TPA: sodium/substrate symporter small subunit [Limnobacter sp.]|uniref:DUF4212 domain-containing protein n=1 Tax=Limnobacter sp. TaxID=2003368 RepID=UPI002EDADB88
MRSPEPLLSPQQYAYWQAVKRLTWRILGVWIALILGAVLFAPVSEAVLFGVPLSYWIISGALLVSFLGLVVCYAWTMDRIDGHPNSTPTKAMNNNRAEAGDTHEDQLRGSDASRH